MNILDAIKSGKIKKRTSNPEWEDPSKRYLYTTDDILATDWEIEERKIEITESEFDEAVEDIKYYGAICPFKLKKRLFAARSGET